MKKFLMILPVAALALSACGATPGQRAATGGLAGAALGAAVSDGDNRVEGAIIGAAVGVAASTLIGPAQSPGQCYYRRADGTRFIAAC
jgi:hypothetical protein